MRTNQKSSIFKGKSFLVFISIYSKKTGTLLLQGIKFMLIVDSLPPAMNKIAHIVSRTPALLVIPTKRKHAIVLLVDDKVALVSCTFFLPLGKMT